MINTKRLLQMAKKWQRVASLGRPRIISAMTDAECSTSVASRGHVFVYSADGKRFMIPITYLSSTILRELFKMSEEEFGLPSDGPITLPCDSTCMEYIISLLTYRVSTNVERAVLTTIASSHYAVSSLPLLRHEQQNLPLCGF